MAKDKIETLRKMGAAEIMGEAIANFIKDEKIKEKAIIPLFDAIGIVHRCRATKSKFGEGVAFKGEFYAKRKDGDEFKSGEFFAPGSFRDDLEGQWVRRKEGVDFIEFGIKVAVQKDKDASAHGYAYIIEPLVKMGGANAIAGLAERAFGKAIPSLASPK